MTPTQCRMARAALGWTIRSLADRANVAPSTINHFEKGRHVHENSIMSIETILTESNEIQFVTDQGVFYVKKNDSEK